MTKFKNYSSSSNVRVKRFKEENELNELIKITENENGKQIVSAKELYLGLGLVKKNWTRWYPVNIIDNDFFREGYDFVGVPLKEEGNETMDFAISLDFAKHIAMMARTEKSHEYRNYFIECEKVIKELKPTCIEDVLISSLQQMKALKGEVQAIKKANEETKGEIQGIRDIIEINPSAAWRKEVNRLLNIMGKKINNYNLPKNESYNALKDRAKCRPNVLIENLKKRATNNGMAPSKISQINMLDVLENEPRLREVYISIVKEMAIKYGI